MILKTILTACIMLVAGIAFAQRPPASWNTSSTSVLCKIFFDTSGNLAGLDGSDFIGVFYDSAGVKLKCGGYIQVNALLKNSPLYANGQNDTLSKGGKMGFYPDDSLYFKYYNVKQNCIYTIDPVFDSGPSTFGFGKAIFVKTFKVLYFNVKYLTDQICLTGMNQVIKPEITNKPKYSDTEMYFSAGSMSRAVDFRTGAIHTDSLSAGILRIWVFSPYLCPDTQYVEIKVGKPDVKLGADTTICRGSKISLENKFNSTGVYKNFWRSSADSSIMSTEQSIEVDQSGFYSLEVTDIYNCKASDTILISVFQSKMAKADLGGDTTICEGATIVLENKLKATGVYTNNWRSLSDSTFSSAGESISGQLSGLYILQVTDTNNCVDSDSILIRILPSDISGFKYYVTPATCGGNTGIFAWDQKSTLPGFNFEIKEINTEFIKRDSGIVFSGLKSGHYSITGNYGSCTSVYPDTIVISDQALAQGYKYELTHVKCGKKGALIITEMPDGDFYTKVSLLDIKKSDTLYSVSGNFVALESGSYRLIFSGKDCTFEAPDMITISNEDCDEENILVIGDPEGGIVPVNFTGKVKVFDRYGKLQKVFVAPATWDGTNSSGDYVPMGQYAIVSENEQKMMVVVIY